MTVLQTILLSLTTMYGGAYLGGYYSAIFTQRTKRKRSQILKPKNWNWSISFKGFGVKV